MLLNQRASDGESETCVAAVRRARSVGARKRVEGVLAEVGRESLPLIEYRNLHGGLVIGKFVGELVGDRDVNNPAVGGVADRVFYQVPNCAADVEGIGVGLARPARVYPQCD